MTAETTPDRWAALLDAVAASPVRRSVTPASLPPEPGEDLLAAAKRLAGRVPGVAAALGIEAPRPAAPARPPRPPRPPGQTGPVRDRPPPRPPMPTAATPPPGPPPSTEPAPTDDGANGAASEDVLAEEGEAVERF